MQDGVDGGEDARVVAVGELHQLGDIADFVARVVAGAKARAADIDGVSAVQDRFAGDGHVTGGAEQFRVILWEGHVVRVGLSRSRRALYR